MDTTEIMDTNPSLKQETASILSGYFTIFIHNQT